MHKIPFAPAPPSRARIGSGWLIAAAVVIGAGFTAPGRAQAEANDTCPPSIIFLRSYTPSGPFSTSALVYDTTFVDVWTAHVTFDRTAGSMSLSASSGGRMNATVRVVEQFDVVGVPLGTPVTAVMEFRLDGWSEQACGGSGCGVLFQGTLVAGGDSVIADGNIPGPGTLHRDVAVTLSLPVTFVAGSPIQAEFLLEYGTGPGGASASAQGIARYRVSGLPAGVHSIACAGTDVTPVRRATWGSLKTLYR